MIGMNLIARRQERTFVRLSRGEWTASTARMSDDVRHVFPGDHPLGGERRSRDAVLRWFERLGRLYPGHDFEVHRVLSGAERIVA
jgi:ketosteroid isomerase-like protein